MDIEEGNDYYYFFETYEDALEYAKENMGTEPPLALIVQEEYIEESRPGQYVHIKKQRLTEWPIEFLSRPKNKLKYDHRFPLAKRAKQQIRNIMRTSIVLCIFVF